ncbi:hypothetical protein [Streptomyces sp. NPDC004296]|uniref:hypothetical protein n=1 Tax=Streptomyces sp. NPDC004296 TaxID=3364697 RepID=UPI003694B79B
MPLDCLAPWAKKTAMSFCQALSGIASGVRNSKGTSRGTTAMTDSAAARIISGSTLV